MCIRDRQNAVWKGPNGITAEGLTLTIPKVKNIHDGGYQVSVLKDGCYSAFSQLNFVEVKDSIAPASPSETSVSLCKSEESTVPVSYTHLCLLYTSRCV